MSTFAIDKERADSALLSMSPPRGYETWKNIGISYKAAGGDLDTFLGWSGSDPDNFNEAQARRLFEHVDEDGRITAGTPEAGVWLCQNPTNGEGRGKDRTTAYRHALIESDRSLGSCCIGTARRLSGWNSSCAISRHPSPRTSGSGIPSTRRT